VQSKPNFTPIWHNTLNLHAVCPACHHAGESQLGLQIDSTISPNPPLTFVWCSACGSLFQDAFKAPEYTDPGHLDVRLKFYVELGAGLDILTLPAFIAHAHGPMRDYLEVGCGFGFGLDFAHHAFGWSARGMDPSPIAIEGQRLLGVAIESRYLGRADRVGSTPHDAIAAMEVIEHIEGPDEFLAILKDNLRSDGILILSTPNAGHIEFGKDKPGTLGLLCPGYHAVLFSKEGLERALSRAGFAEMQVFTRGATLLALAGIGATRIDPDKVFDPDRYARYLTDRMTSFQKGSSRRGIKSVVLDRFKLGRFKHASEDKRTILNIGFGYRLFKHYVNRGEFDRAVPILGHLAEIIRERDGLDILDPFEVINAVKKITTFPSLVEEFPVCLVGLLFFHAMLQINHYQDRHAALSLFYAAFLVATRFNSILRDAGFEDGETADLQNVALKHVKLMAELIAS
jgi:2-polyprenyl-3-methyl-5-hydroxy-6-metoxy-1,4-benzoquinol methylase